MQKKDMLKFEHVFFVKSALSQICQAILWGLFGLEAILEGYDSVICSLMLGVAYEVTCSYELEATVLALFQGLLYLTVCKGLYAIGIEVVCVGLILGNIACITDSKEGLIKIYLY